MLDVMQSAASYVHWGRYVSRFAAEGHTPWIASIRVPVLAILGALELEESPHMRANFENMRSRAVQSPRFDIQVIEGATIAMRATSSSWPRWWQTGLQTCPCDEGCNVEALTERTSGCRATLGQPVGFWEPMRSRP